MNRPPIQDPITPLPPMRLLIFAVSAVFPSVAYLVVRSPDGGVTLGGIAKIAAAWLIGYLVSDGYYNHRMQVRLQALAFEVKKSLPELERRHVALRLLEGHTRWESARGGYEFTAMLFDGLSPDAAPETRLATRNSAEFEESVRTAVIHALITHGWTKERGPKTLLIMWYPSKLPS
ncbi:MAG: hypothetical protein ACK5C3_14110 [bacterium]|jgi:hypothetical protein